MKNEKFERMLAEIRNEQVDDQVVAQAGERVWKSIAGNAPASDLNAHTLRSCDDFQALIPDIWQNNWRRRAPCCLKITCTRV